MGGIKLQNEWWISLKYTIHNMKETKTLRKLKTQILMVMIWWMTCQLNIRKDM